MSGAFSSLSDKLGHIFSKLKNKGRLTELEIKQAMREVRVALLEADVNFVVVKQFIQKVTEKAVGQEILKSLTPAQQVIKIVNDELIELMGSTHSKLNISSKPPTVIMMCGLQGAGKTTMCGKLGKMLKKQGKNPLLVACDIYRPAAINQLKVVSEKAGVDFFEMGQVNPVKIYKKALEKAEKLGNDYIIIDTAGRLHIDEELMQELIELKSKAKPSDILLTVDAMTGQDAVNVAQTFNEKLDITGVIVTKLDGDTRGGAALSIKAVTGKPIKFCGIGEKIEDIEVFYPDRMANRILGMGDILTLIEKAQDAVSEEEMKLMEKKFRESSFNLNDYLQQMDSLKKMGDIQSVMSMLPNMGNKIKVDSASMDENRMKRTKAILLSMTNAERENPDLLNGNRRKRIAKGSGTSIQEINQLLKQFEQAKTIMKQMKGGKRRGGFPF